MVICQVLKTLWSEPVGGGSGETQSEEAGSIELSIYGERTYHSFRHFVIVKALEGHCWCV